MSAPLANHAQLDGVSLQLGGHPVLSDLRLDIPLDGRTILLGPNGSGKSSLLFLLQGLHAPTCGRLSVRAGVQHVPGPGPLPRRRNFALVFQKPVMLRRTALANVTHALACAGVPSSLAPTHALRALDAVGLGYAAARMARVLSGGEQQRLALARAWALDPLCLLCDEPTASLDPTAAAGLEQLLMTLAGRGTGLLMSTHDLAQARRMAEFVIFLHQGRVRAAAPADHFFNAPGDPLVERFLAGELLAPARETGPLPIQGASR
ncbi:MAG: ATP-binding cassette domain-containing protein [Burkholderiaceae bacterium]